MLLILFILYVHHKNHAILFFGKEMFDAWLDNFFKINKSLFGQSLSNYFQEIF